MLESSERSELERKEKEASRLLSARKRKVVKQTPGFHAANTVPKIGLPSAINTILNRPLRPTAGPPRPSAGDYIPPTSFLQNMTNPSNETVYPKSVPEYFK